MRFEESGEGELLHLRVGSALFVNKRAKRSVFRAMMEGVVEFLEREVERLS